MTLLCIGLWWLFLMGKMRKSARVFVLVLFLISGALSMREYYRVVHPLALVACDTPLHLGPDVKYASRDILKKGDAVVIDSSYNGWCYISHCTTTCMFSFWRMCFCRKTVRGWVASDALQRKAPDL